MTPRDRPPEGTTGYELAMLEAESPPPALVLFDGECAVCDATVQWLMARDRNGRLAYAPLQGTTAAPILARHAALPPDLDSIVFVQQHASGERVTWHTEALLRIASELPWPWRALASARIVPSLIRDAMYRAFARSRYRLFGRIDQCRLPSEEEAARILP